MCCRVADRTPRTLLDDFSVCFAVGLSRHEAGAKLVLPFRGTGGALDGRHIAGRERLR